MVSNEVKEWLNNYEGDFPFYVSLKNQLNARGTLSVRQVEAVERAIERDSRPREKVEIPYKVGDVIEIKAWLSKKLAEQHDRPFFFRNLKIKEVHNATRKAMLVTVGFHSGICTSCHVCGRTLTNDFSKATGIGPVCAERVLSRPILSDFDIEAILSEMERWSKEQGDFKVWLPFSQIKRD